MTELLWVLVGIVGFIIGWIMFQGPDFPEDPHPSTVEDWRKTEGLRKVKVVTITPDFEHDPAMSTSEHYQRADREKARLVNLMLEGSVKLVSPNTSDLECYCDACKAMFSGSWFAHQKTVHGRNLP